ncbi:hypothetical protein CDN99_14730 [Roseateles aquatilis]|uniref:Uncharacterized protein n=2 Tax=Roseateles aquatilis TaxID=431061 RepID=A0A246J7W5_9BURK|nr:hypothetical protein CDN99_14730 [Roseateles aquatilis]
MDIERIEKVLHANTSIETIHLRDLRGGNPLHARFVLRGAFAFRQVEVHGACAAACAYLALTARAPVLHGDATITLGPGALVFSQWLLEPSWQDTQDWIADRLPTVPTAFIKAVLSSHGAHERQLVMHPARGRTGLIAVRYCDPAPDKCRLLQYIQPGASRLVVAPGEGSDRD